MRWYLPSVLLLGQTALATDPPSPPPLPNLPPPPSLPNLPPLPNLPDLPDLPNLPDFPRPPVIDLNDLRFWDYKPPGPGDSRSPCPALNAAANHGFIPRNGRNINIVHAIVGLFLALGVSPETSGFIWAVGLISSHNPLTLAFDLEDLSRHLFAIEHDNSFARNDKLIGNNNDFNMTLWKVPLEHLKQHAIITPSRLGRAKGFRVEANKKLNPRTVYGPRSSVFGAMEAGLILSAMGSPVPGFAKLEYVRSIFEEERLPYHLGWRPVPFGCNLATFNIYSIPALAGDPFLIQHGIAAILGTPSDIIQTILPPELDFIPQLTGIITNIGFDASLMDGLNQLIGYRPPGSN